MEQSEFSQRFISAMLGWVRSLAQGIASMFQSANGSTSSSGGMAALKWFTENWFKLLIGLIILGLIIDWLVWILRWRPYWAWFRKKRVLLDDDIDIHLSEDELYRRYGHPYKRRREDGYMYTSRALRREDRAFEKDDPRYNDDLLEDFDANEIFTDDESIEEFDTDINTHFDESGNEKSSDDELMEDTDSEEDVFDDMFENDYENDSDEYTQSSSKKKRFSGFLNKKRQKDEMDPFDADSEEFRDLNDDFLDVIAREPRGHLNMFDNDESDSFISSGSDITKVSGHTNVIDQTSDKAISKTDLFDDFDSDDHETLS